MCVCVRVCVCVCVCVCGLSVLPNMVRASKVYGITLSMFIFSQVCMITQSSGNRGT